MKNQYFGDINDFLKFGLLRSIIKATGWRIHVTWMLTEDDGSTDGHLTDYLVDSVRWRNCDPLLFDELNQLLTHNEVRRVSLIEGTNLLRDSQYYSVDLRDSAVDRNAWFQLLMVRVQSSDLVFLDPDIGLEVPSMPYGRKGSSKYLYLNEVEQLWAADKSLLVYQHFPREERMSYVERLKARLTQLIPGSTIVAFFTVNVVFLLMLQAAHVPALPEILQVVRSGWNDKIHCE